MTEFGGRTKDPVASDPVQAGPGPDETAAATAAPADDPVVRRTKDGWRVGGSDLPDLTSAMVLADLISAELTADEASASDSVSASASASTGSGLAAAAADKPDREPATTETSRLRATIGQLEHALTARIRVEQAIGVLAERHRIQPRQAFEQLRSAARSRGRRVIDIASDVVASATNPLLQLPDELSRPRSAGRRARPPRSMLSSE